MSMSTSLSREERRGRRERSWLEVLPLDPRDPDVLRANALAVGARSWEGLPSADEGERAAMESQASSGGAEDA